MLACVIMYSILFQDGDIGPKCRGTVPSEMERLPLQPDPMLPRLARQPRDVRRQHHVQRPHLQGPQARPLRLLPRLQIHAEKGSGTAFHATSHFLAWCPAGGRSGHLGLYV